MPLVLRSETNVRCSIEARRVTYNDPHTAGRFVSAIIDAGLQVKFLHEFAVSCFRIFPFMRLNDDGWYRLPPKDGDLPLPSSLRARKPA